MPDYFKAHQKEHIQGAMYSLGALSLVMFFVFTADIKQSPLAQTSSAEKMEQQIAEAKTYEGTIIDNRCAGKHVVDIETFVSVHDKTCAIESGDSGYSLYTEGRLIPFQEVSDPRILEFLKSSDGNLLVEITAKESGDGLELVSIKSR